MQQYKMSFLDRLDFVVTSRPFDAATDTEALLHAQTLCWSHKIVVTQEDRLVGKVAKGTHT